MYFLNQERKQKKVENMNKVITDLEERKKIHEQLIELFKAEIEEAYRAPVIEELLNNIGVISGKDQKTET